MAKLISFAVIEKEILYYRGLGENLGINCCAGAK